MKMNQDFGSALKALKEGKRVARKGWAAPGLFVFMQVPATIQLEIIPKMTSLPQSVKDAFDLREAPINYCNQLALVKPDNEINGWAPSVSDALAEDWIILDVQEVQVEPAGGRFTKKPVTIEAVTFEEFVAYGIEHAESLNNGVPWHFKYKGHPITHETNDCYLIPTLEGTMKFNRGEMLITGVKGEIYPCKMDIFQATYEPVKVDVASNLPPHQQRVLQEHAELEEKLKKLGDFIQSNPLYETLPEEEQRRLTNQHFHMAEYEEILRERIAPFPKA